MTTDTPAAVATAAIASLYIIQRTDSAPFLRVQEIMPKSEEDRRQQLMSRNPASQTKEEAEQRLANCFAARANAALAEAQTYLKALEQSPVPATMPIQSMRLTALPLGGEGEIQAITPQRSKHQTQKKISTRSV